MSRFPPCALALAAAAAALLAAAPARAQLRLPGLPALPGTVLPAPTPPSPRLAELLPGDVPLQELRARLVRDLLRERGSRLETDPAGEPVVRGELVVAAPTDPFLVAARAQGFRVLREQTLEGLDLRSAVLAAPEGMATAQALARLRALDPAAQVDYQHVYLHGGAVEPAAAPDRTAASTDVTVGAGRVGLVDGGVEHDHPALRGAELRVWGCGGQRWPSVHGTAVASLLVGRDRGFRGAMPHAILYAADVYCGQDTGGSVEAVVQALAWMARERVAVVNVSLVGPPNRLLEAAVRAFTARGHLVVAAVGNDGPAAPPLYPAAYEGVVGVTAVAPSRRVLPEAAQGPQVSLAAPGSDMAVAQSGTGGYATARGTSFAAPLVAGLLGELLPQPNPEVARRVIALLAAQAADLGAPGRDPVYGWGLVGEQLRIATDRVPAARRAMR